MESQVLQDDAASEQGSMAAPRAAAPPHVGVANADGSSPMYNFNLSFEELSNLGLEEPPRTSNLQWMVSQDPNPTYRGSQPGLDLL